MAFNQGNEKEKSAGYWNTSTFFGVDYLAREKMVYSGVPKEVVMVAKSMPVSARL
jgi:hypothetical protein